MIKLAKHMHASLFVIMEALKNLADAVALYMELNW
jgi:hypothetical protein